MKILIIVRIIFVIMMVFVLMGIMILYVGVGSDSWDSYVKKMFSIAMYGYVLMVEFVMMKLTIFVVFV